MSVQWRNEPYFYPIQIAQFGLQHYSQMVDESYGLNGSFPLYNLKSIYSFYIVYSNNYLIINYFLIFKFPVNWEPQPLTPNEIALEDFFTGQLKFLTRQNLTSVFIAVSAHKKIYLMKAREFLIIMFSWKPFNKNSSFSIQFSLDETDLSSTYELNFKFTPKKECLWVEKDACTNSSLKNVFSLLFKI